jgi:formylglycine-generating enzyme required for sulfatase activity
MMAHDRFTPGTRIAPTSIWLFIACAMACRERSVSDARPEPAGSSSESAALAPLSAAETPGAAQPTTTHLGVQKVALAPAPAPADAGAADRDAPPVLTVSELEPAFADDACPAGMRHVRGGEFWMGSPRRRGASEERPRYQTRVADYCIDEREVTTAEYTQCVAAGRCSPPLGSQFTCNYERRESHPINCVDWNQAQSYCASQGARLPTELEWEYAARGGEKYSTYAWGEESPDGRACWKASHSCEAGSFAAGAFGLHDMTGNVWEWTNDWFADYPWPKADGVNKVFRGGGWSRRFDKWMRSTLRNRTSPETWGSHLGFRCARLADGSKCPFGEGDEPGLCRHGVLAVECKTPQHEFNGMRCALPGEPQCRAGQEAVPGQGCVSPNGGAARSRRDADEREEQPTRRRSPEFDGDCRSNQPKRPNAFLFEGGSHKGRNRYGRELGCKNRDVGVGWNSACCP